MRDKRKLIALAIWWCEGTKLRKDKRWKNALHYVIEVTNTNPDIIKIFIDFLIKDLLVPKEKFKLQIQIHEGDNQQELETFWSKTADIPLVQFNKTIIRKKGNKVGKNQGTCKIRIYDKILFAKINSLLLEELKEIRGIAQLA